MNVPKETGVQTRCFKEHLFGFTKQEERWHFTCRLVREINICSVSGVCLRAALSFTARKKSDFYYHHMYYELCCISLLHCVLLSTVQMLNSYSPQLLRDF